ncbi:hypothetical protein NDL36_000454 [Vibrio parahaemolyticus]|nr:hypothetical protein [Vibrio parahaemolyticus]
MENIKTGRDILISQVAVIITVLSGFFYLLGSLLQRFYLKMYGLGSSHFSQPVAEHISAGFMHFITVPSILLLIALYIVFSLILNRGKGLPSVYPIVFSTFAAYLPLTSILNGYFFSEGVRQVGAEVNVCTKESTGEHCYCGKMIIQDASKVALLVDSKAYVIPYSNINHYSVAQVAQVAQKVSENSCTNPEIKPALINPISESQAEQ